MSSEHTNLSTEGVVGIWWVDDRGGALRGRSLLVHDVESAGLGHGHRSMDREHVLPLEVGHEEVAGDVHTRVALVELNHICPWSIQ